MITPLTALSRLQTSRGVSCKSGRSSGQLGIDPDFTVGAWADGEVGRLGCRKGLGPDPVDWNESTLPDFVVAGDNAGIFSLGQGNRKGVAKSNRMRGLDPGGGDYAILIRQHQPNRKGWQT